MLSVANLLPSLSRASCMLCARALSAAAQNRVGFYGLSLFCLASGRTCVWQGIRSYSSCCGARAGGRVARGRAWPRAVQACTFRARTKMPLSPMGQHPRRLLVYRNAVEIYEPGGKAVEPYKSEGFGWIRGDSRSKGSSMLWCLPRSEPCFIFIRILKR